MKTLGIIGGIAPPSTMDYYRLLIDTYRERRPDGSYPQILINSINLARMLDLVNASRLKEMETWLLEEIGRLAHAGADVGVLASNTPHIIFDELARGSPIPLISIVEATREAARSQGLRTVGLLGTRSTMQSGFYGRVFAQAGIAVLAPTQDDQALVHDRYMKQLVAGELRPETRAEFLAVIERLRKAGAEAVLLAGTEIPLLLRGAVDSRIPLLDTARIHVARAVVEILS
jgi:aspartate racemase